MLESRNFFDHLRSDLRQAGLAGEEKYGVAIFFVTASRFLPCPLRLVVAERTEGSAKYLVQSVSKLLEPGAVCNVFSEAGWLRFVGEPKGKVAYARDWSAPDNGPMRAEVEGNRLVRLMRSRRDGRVLEDPEEVQAAFACISVHGCPETSSHGRWLSLELPSPPLTAGGTTALEGTRVSVWIEVQRLLKEHGQLKFVLPDWADVFVDRVCRGANSGFHLPAYLAAWKTMGLLRSFQNGQRWREAEKNGAYVTTFDDLATAGALLRGIYRGGQSFPSLDKLAADVFPDMTEFTVLNPLTGTGKRHVLKRKGKPQDRSLLEWVEGKR
jgi:hypothetical protein